MILALILALSLGVLATVLGAELLGWLGCLSRLLLAAASRRLPPSKRERWREEWEADLVEFADRPLTQFVHALLTFGTARALSRELTSRKMRILDAVWRLPLPLIDASSLVIGSYTAVVLGEVFAGRFQIDWTVLWVSTSNWLPLIVPATILVLWGAGLYASPSIHGRLARLACALLVVAFASLIYGVWTGHMITTTTVVPPGFVLCAAIIAVQRWSYEFTTGELRKLARHGFENR